MYPSSVSIYIYNHFKPNYNQHLLLGSDIEMDNTNYNKQTGFRVVCFLRFNQLHAQQLEHFTTPRCQLWSIDGIVARGSLWWCKEERYMQVMAVDMQLLESGNGSGSNSNGEGVNDTDGGYRGGEGYGTKGAVLWEVVVVVAEKEHKGMDIEVEVVEEAEVKVDIMLEEVKELERDMVAGEGYGGGGSIDGDSGGGGKPS